MCLVLVMAILFGCDNAKNKTPDVPTPNENTEITNQQEQEAQSEPQEQSESSGNTSVTENKLTAEMAYEGVSNYCHSEYDWSPAEENPEIMYVTAGEETESEYKIIFRSYTSTMTYFYVDKLTGKTKMTEYVPSLDIEEDKGTINIYDYLN